jgi:hypothetical protein
MPVDNPELSFLLWIAGSIGGSREHNTLWQSGDIILPLLSRDFNSNVDC